MLTLEERIARLEKQTHVVSVHADSNSAALADIPDEVRGVGDRIRLQGSVQD